jgi:FAD:protein FMN transferase
VQAIAAAGAERVMVDAGGDIGSGGAAVGDDPWTIAIEDPHQPGRSVGRVRLAGQAIATSGDYMQAFTQDRRHHHILDPRTGRSPEHTSSVTVTAATAMDADALSTALLVLGPEEGLALLERVPGAEGVVVTKDGRRFASQGLA